MVASFCFGFHFLLFSFFVYFFSCTASSCDFWPHCGLTTLNQINLDQNSLKICDTVNSNKESNVNSHSHNKKDEHFTKSSKQSSDLVSVTVISSNARKPVLMANDKSDDIKVVKVTTPTSKKPPICEKLNRSSLTMLGEREMPITRESIASKVGANQVRVDYKTGETSEKDQKSTPTINDVKSGCNDSKIR